MTITRRTFLGGLLATAAAPALAAPPIARGAVLAFDPGSPIGDWSAMALCGGHGNFAGNEFFIYRAPTWKPAEPD